MGDIEQRLEFIGEAKKKKRLEELLVGAEPPIIVFVNQKKAVDVLAKSLDNSGYRVCSIHGGKSQDQREWAMNSFKEGRYDILVATDVAGRGLDIEGVMQVINFDMPKTIDGYARGLRDLLRPHPVPQVLQPDCAPRVGLASGVEVQARHAQRTRPGDGHQDQGSHRVRQEVSAWLLVGLESARARAQFAGLRAQLCSACPQDYGASLSLRILYPCSQRKT